MVPTRAPVAVARPVDVLRAGATGRAADLGSIAILSALALLVVSRALVGHGILGRYPSDGTRAMYFVQEYLLGSLREGRVPLWNPFTHFGTPFLANIQWAALYPLHLLFVPMAEDVAYNLFIALHLAIGGAAMYLLARTWRLEPVPAFVAALAYMLNGRFVAHAWGGTINMLSAAVWLPLALVVFLRALEAPRCRVAWMVAASGVVALDILSGHPQEMFFTVFVLFLAALWETRQIPRAGVWRRVQPVIVWCGVVVGGAGLAAAQLVPTSVATRLSTRSFEWGLAWPPPAVMGHYNPVRLLSWFVPDLFGNTVSLPPASTDWLSLVLHEVHSNEFRAYVGVFPLLLSLYSLTGWRREARIRFLVLAAGVSIVLAFGQFTPIYGLVSALVPPFRTFRVASRFMSVVVFAMALLAGFGAQRLLRSAGDAAQAAAELRRCVRWLALMAVAMGVAVVVGVLVRPYVVEVGQRLAGPVFASRPSGAGLTPAERDGLVNGAYWLALRATGFTAALVGAGAGVFVVAARRGLRRHLPLAIVGLTVLDLALQTAPYTGFTVMDELMAQHAPLVAALRKFGGDGWVFPFSEDPARVSRDIVVPNENALIHHGLFTAGGYDPFELKTYRALRDTLADDLRKGSSFVASALGVRVVVTDLALAGPDFRVVGRLDTATIYENTHAQPRFYMVSAARVVEGPGEALAALASHGFVPTATVLIEGGVADFAGTPEPPGTVETRSSSAQRTLLDVTANGAGWLVANQSFYPGVSATVDGRSVAVLRANGHVCAVPVSAGRHMVEIEFQPAELRIGAAGSLVSIVIAIAVAASSLVRDRSLRRRRKEEPKGR